MIFSSCFFSISDWRFACIPLRCIAESTRFRWSTTMGGSHCFTPKEAWTWNSPNPLRFFYRRRSSQISVDNTLYELEKWNQGIDSKSISMVHFAYASSAFLVSFAVSQLFRVCSRAVLYVFLSLPFIQQRSIQHSKNFPFNSVRGISNFPNSETISASF